jgi:DNA-binding CsgD family transcriptional regulator
MENGHTNSKEASERQRFLETTSRLMTSVIAMIDSGTPMDQVLGEEPDCIYLKSADRKMLYTNQAFHQVFSKDDLIVGVHVESRFSGSTVELSQHSDTMIMSGCRYVVFDHVGHNEDGVRLRMSTAKYSLLGLGHSSLAIMGVTRTYEQLDDESDPRVQVNTLIARWSQFESLNPIGREIAIELVRGKAVQQIAEEREVSKRTIENYRGAVLKELGVASPIELAKLLVRFQENGFGDLKVD